MNRAEFLKICGILGIGLPMQYSLSSCNKEKNTTPFTGNVLIIGAGAGGLSAGYLLQQQGTNFTILEASNQIGGRMRINNNFADFPIPLGAEWLETNPSIFNEIVNDSSVNVNIETYEDLPDRKFVNYSWFNFYEDYIAPSVADKIIFNEVVSTINYSDNKVIVTTQNGQYIADKVVISVPLKILQNQEITFTPALPQSKLDAINQVEIWDGFKAFFEFSNKFYDDEREINVNPNTAGQKIFYNAALGQNTSKNILGLFVVGLPAQDYITRSGNALKTFILDELDALYSNQATPNYLNHISQNWNNEPFIKGGYLSDYANWRKVKTLSEPIDSKVFFSGSEYTDGEDWVSVNTAAMSAKNAVNEINS